MSKEIHYLAGTEGCGKTETLNRACQKILGLDPNSELTAVLKINGINVGISTHGDYPWEVKDSLKYFADKGCEVILIATRSKGGTKKAVESYKTTYDVYRIIKKGLENPKDQAACTRANQKVADELVAKTLSALGIPTEHINS